MTTLPTARHDPTSPQEAVTRPGSTLLRGRFLDPKRERLLDAVLVAEGTIQEVTERGARPGPLSDRAGAVVDLRAHGDVVPGFVDAHTHLEIGAKVLGLNVPVHSPPMTSIDDIVEALRGADRAKPGPGWLEAQGNLGQSYRLPERRYPTRHDLDRVSAERPVIVRFGAHVWCFNSAGLRRLGIDRTTSLPDPAHLDLDADGEPTGITNDLIMIRKQRPDLALPQPDADSFRAALVDAARTYFTSRGVTTIGEMSDGVGELAELRARLDDGAIPLRVVLYAIDPAVTELLAAGRLDDLRTATDRLLVGGYKLAADGGISAREAAVWQPYPDRPGHRGKLGLTLEQIAEVVRRAEEQGLQVLVHAAGDRAMDLALDAFEQVRGELGSWRSRHRIEHLGNVFATDERLARCRDLGILPVANIGFLHGIGDSMRGVVGEGFENAPLYRLRAILDHRMSAVGASDFAGGLPEISHPLFLMRVMRERRTFAGVLLGPGEALTPWEALRSVTTDAASGLQLDDRVGTFAPGAHADFAVLSGSLLDASPEQLTDGAIRVEQTWLAGNPVWRGETA